jgi:hypothetical protein
MDLERNLPTKRKRPPEFPNPWKANRHKQKQSRTGRQKAKRESIKAKKQNTNARTTKSPISMHMPPYCAPAKKRKKTTNNTTMQRQHSAEFVDPKTIPVVGGAH